MQGLKLLYPPLTSCVRWMSQSTATSTKNSLALLRKKTGLAFNLCKSALEMHNQDVKKAEEWLKAEAQRRGWEKAAKVQGRPTTQGLVAVHAKNNVAAMIEVNCESDFVARNATFQELVSRVAVFCHQHAASKQIEKPLEKWSLTSEAIASLPWENDKKVSDLVATYIGKLGENMMLRKGVCMKSQEGIHLSFNTHPDTNHHQGTLLGKFGAIVAFRQLSGESEDIPKDIKKHLTNLKTFGRQLCQHVVGMHPRSIGRPDDKPADDPESEDKMLFQEFIFNPEITVKDVLFEYDIEIVDFVRFECGEMPEEE